MNSAEQAIASVEGRGYRFVLDSDGVKVVAHPGVDIPETFLCSVRPHREEIARILRERREVASDAAYDAFAARRVDVWSLIEAGIPAREALVSPWLIRGAITAVGSEPGIGKTWLMLHAVLNVLRMGLRVLLLDQEAGERDTAERLRDMGLTADEANRLHYFPFAVGGGLSLSDTARVLRRAMREGDVALLACDSMSKFFGAFRLSENSNDDATLLMGNLFTPLAHEDGRTVLLLDHVVKNGESGRYTRGAGSKLADVDVQWSMDAPAPFGRGTMGRIVLTKQKDRLSTVPGTVRFLVGGDGSGAFTVKLEASSFAEPVRVNENSRKFVAALHGEGNTGLTYTEWFAATGAAERTFKDHRKSLVEVGAIAQRKERYYVTPRGIAAYLPHIAAEADEGEMGADAPVRPHATEGAEGAASYTFAPSAPHSPADDARESADDADASLWANRGGAGRNADRQWLANWCEQHRDATDDTPPSPGIRAVAIKCGIPPHDGEAAAAFAARAAMWFTARNAA